MTITHNLEFVLKKPYSDFSGEFGLPNTLREKLLQIGYGESALVLDALIYAGAKRGRAYTFRQIVLMLREAGFQMSEGLIWRGLTVAKIFPRDTLVKGSGRPFKRYYMPLVGKLLGRFGLEGYLVSDNFRVGDFDSLTLYRRALHREFVRREPGTYSRQFLGGRLGVCKRTTWNYDRAIGIQSEQRFRRKRLAWRVDIERACAHAEPGKNWIEALYGETGELKRWPCKTYLANREYQKGAQIFLVTQLPNYYWIEAENLNNTESIINY